MNKTIYKKNKITSAKTEKNDKSDSFIIPTEKLRSMRDTVYFVAALMVAIIGIRFVARDLIAPVLLALFLTALMMPIFKYFRRKGFGSITSLLLMLGSALSAIIGLIALLSWSVILVGDAISASLTQFSISSNNFVERLIGDQQIVNSLFSTIQPDVVLGSAISLLDSLIGVGLSFLVVALLSVMLLLHIDSVPKDLAVSLMKESSVLSRFQRFFQATSLYMIGRFKVNLITGVLFLISLVFMGIPHAFLWGLLTVILSFIPYVGIVLAGLMPTLLAYSQGGFVLALIVVVVLTALNLFTENILDPYIQGQQTKISAAAIIIAFLFWTWLLGPIGAVLSTPLSVLLKFVLADYQETRWLASLMEGNYEASKSQVNKTGFLKKWWGKIAS